MDSGKPWFQSRTIWGVVIAALAQILDKAGVVTIDDAAQQELVEIAVGIATALGLLLAIIGRLFAKKTITPVKPPPGSAVAILMMVLVAGCANMNDTATEIGERVGEAADQRGVGQATADGLIKVDETDYRQRGWRFCVLSAIAVETMTRRISTLDQAETDKAAGAAERLTDACDRVFAADRDWVEIEMFYAEDDLIGVVVAGAKASGKSLAINIISKDVLGILDRAELALDQIQIAGRMLQDARRQAAEFKDGKRTLEQLKAAAQNRIGRNRAILNALRGRAPSMGVSP